MEFKEIPLTGDRSVSVSVKPDGNGDTFILFKRPVDELDNEDTKTCVMEVKDNEFRTYVKISSEALAALALLTSENLISTLIKEPPD